MDDTDALELSELEAFVLALLDGGPLVAPADPAAAAEGASMAGALRVQVDCGPECVEVEHAAGMTVASLRAGGLPFSVPPVAEALVNGRRVRDTHPVAPRDHVEFVRCFGGDTVGAARALREDPVTERDGTADSLPLFSNASVCPACGNRRVIRVHFDRSCTQATGDHYHRICDCRHEWVERCGPS